MELFGFNIPEGNNELEDQLRDVYIKAFPNGQTQIDLEAESLWEKLGKRYQFSKVKEIYIHASCLYYAYSKNGKDNITRVDKMYFFSSVRDKYNLPRIDMLIIYETLKTKPEINFIMQHQHRDLFKNGIIEAFELFLKEEMNKKEFLSYSNTQKRLTIQMAIVTVWKHYYNADFSQFSDETNLSEMVLKDIICEVREEMLNKYLK